MVFRIQGDMLRIIVKRLLFVGSEWRRINSVQVVRDGENQEQGREVLEVGTGRCMGCKAG